MGKSFPVVEKKQRRCSMTDRVLTENDVEVFQGMIQDGFDLTTKEALELCASHRLQAAWIQELKKELREVWKNARRIYD